MSAQPKPTPDSAPELEQITVFLRQWSSVDPQVRSDLFGLLYPALHKIADGRMRNERIYHSLQATALVHEFFLRLAAIEDIKWMDRGHFLATASRGMRRILIDHARSKGATRHGGGFVTVSLTQVPGPVCEEPAIDPLELDELLDRLAAREPRMAQVVDMHCFGGLTFREIADSLRIGEKTAKRDWQTARAWLRSKMRSKLSVTSLDGE